MPLPRKLGRFNLRCEEIPEKEYEQNPRVLKDRYRVFLGHVDWEGHEMLIASTINKEEAEKIMASVSLMYCVCRWGDLPKGGPLRDPDWKPLSREGLDEFRFYWEKEK